MNGGSAPAVRTLNLVKRYGATTALAGLTMTVQRGEIFGFLGPNGAGKTTAVKLLIGLTRPTAGEAWLLGAPIGDRETRRRIGYLPELFRYQDWLSAREVLRLHCRLAGVPGERQGEEIAHALDTVGLAARADSRVGTFSKGMQQRLGLGVALLGRPDLIFLDEPTSALDPVGRADVRQIVRSLKERGATVFLNSHLLSEVEQVCDRVAVVDKGRVIAEGSIAEVVGGSHAVRLRIPDVNADVRAALGRYGPLTSQGEWHTVGTVDEAQIPALVAEVVRAGGQVYAVEPRHHTLEDRFLQLLQEPNQATALETWRRGEVTE
ncbi:MAG: ABC transporter ATP-binding protein [Anaerolineae bacterium]